MKKQKIFASLLCLATIISCTATTTVTPNPSASNNPSVNPSSNTNNNKTKPVISRGGAGNTGDKDNVESIDLGAMGKEPTGKGNKTLFAIYLLGSDLEDDVLDPKGTADEVTKQGNVSEGAGSDDLREITNALKGLSEEERANIDIVVGFGGARKSGWKGIKYTDGNCIMKDAGDNYFGNDSCYIKKDDNASMGSGKTLKDFVTFVKENYPEANYGKRIMDLWDHGGAHRGYGPDTNTDESMTLKEINEALAADDTKYSMVGFDACLMGNLDVARFVKNRADYLLASEELEPGHGWQYTEVINHIAKNPTSNIVDIGKYMVDSFISAHPSTDGKTLSLLDLKKIDNVTTSLDNVFDSLGNNINTVYAPILKAAASSQEYGKTGKGDKAFAVDLKHFINKMKENSVTADTSSLESALNEFIVYSKEDGTRKDSTGVAIFAITNKSDFSEKAYRASRSISDKWFGFVNKFVNNGLNDSSAPKVEENTATAAAPKAEENTATAAAPKAEENAAMQTASFKTKNDSSTGFKISDDKGLKEVLSVRSIKATDGSYMIVGVEEAESTQKDIYTNPKWDGSVFMIGNTIVPMEFSETTRDGKKIYMADGIVNDEQVTFNFKVDAGKVIDQWYVPYNEDDKGNILVSKDQDKLEANDEVYFSYLHLDIDKDIEEWRYSDKITLSSEIIPTMKKANGDLSYFIEAYDLKGNMQNSDLIEL